MTPYQIFQIEGVVWEPGGQIRELPPLPGDTISFAFGINEIARVSKSNVFVTRNLWHIERV